MSESNADVWDDGRPVNTKKHDLNKHSDSPQNRNAGMELGQLPISTGESGKSGSDSPQAKPGSHVLGFRGSFLPLIARLGPSSTTLQSQNGWSVLRVRAWSPTRGEGEAGEGPESLSTSSDDTCRKGMQLLRAAAPSRSKRQAAPTDKTV